MPEATEPTVLDKLEESRSKLVDEFTALVEARETERAEFEARRAEKPAEVTDTDVDAFGVAEDAFRDASESLKSQIRALDTRIGDLDEIAQRRAEAAKSHRGAAVVTEEPLTYREDNAH